jgi:phosphomannomutase
VVVGQDVRISSARISQALIEGLSQSGLQVIDVGMVPTPILNFATDYYAAAGGVMVTASHNPPEHNGFKIRDKHRTLNVDEFQEIYRLAATGRPPEPHISGQVESRPRLFLFTWNALNIGSFQKRTDRRGFANVPLRF